MIITTIYVRYMWPALLRLGVYAHAHAHIHTLFAEASCQQRRIIIINISIFEEIYEYNVLM